MRYTILFLFVLWVVYLVMGYNQIITNLNTQLDTNYEAASLCVAHTKTFEMIYNPKTKAITCEELPK